MISEEEIKKSSNLQDQMNKLVEYFDRYLKDKEKFYSKEDHNCLTCGRCNICGRVGCLSDHYVRK